MATDGGVNPSAHREGVSSFGGSSGDHSQMQQKPRPPPSDYSFEGDSSASTAVDASSEYEPSSHGPNGSSSRSENVDLDLDLGLGGLKDLSLKGSSGAPQTRNKRLDVFDGNDDIDGEGRANGAQSEAGDDQGDVVEEEELPEHACAYCGIHNTSCVVKCLGCDKW